MPAFSISPASASTPPTSEGFPNYIQFQSNGTNLGAPTVDIVNFASGLTATRGTGENVNTLTVQAPGGAPGGSTAFVGTFRKFGAPMNQYFALWDQAETLVGSPDCEWTTEIDGESDEYYLLRFIRPGVYEITITGQQRIPSGAGPWPEGPSVYGTSFAGIQGIVEVPDDSVHSRYNPGNQGAPEYVQWSDYAIVNVLQEETLVNVILWADIYFGFGEIDLSGQISVVRLGEAPDPS